MFAAGGLCLYVVSSQVRTAKYSNEMSLFLVVREMWGEAGRGQARGRRQPQVGTLWQSPPAQDVWRVSALGGPLGRINDLTGACQPGHHRHPSTSRETHDATLLQDVKDAVLAYINVEFNAWTLYNKYHRQKYNKIGKILRRTTPGARLPHYHRSLGTNNLWHNPWI